MDWKTFKVKVSDYLDGDNNYTADEYEAMFKAVCVECEKDGNHQIVERDGYFFVEKIPEPTAEELQAQALAQAKAERAEAVNKIVVEVDGMKFDGDEKSQQRVARSIIALEDGETMPWVLYDNTIAEVTKEQLKKVLRLAGQKQSELWVVPYDEHKVEGLGLATVGM